MAKVYRSEALAAVHQMMEGLRRGGAVDRDTMREFDETCLELASGFSPEDIKAIREHEAVSQPVFARYLNVSRSMVADWERGARRPRGPALRLLSVVKRKGLQAIA